MRVLLARLSTLSVCVLAVSAEPARGQSPDLTSAPRLVRFTGSFRPADGHPPAPVETMTLSIYGEDTGGVPLWKETQTAVVNPDGRFTLLLGSTRPEGLPLDLFASGEPRWLAVHVDHVERPGEGEPGRVLLHHAASSSKTPARLASAAKKDTAGSKIEIFGTVKLDAIWNEARPQAPGAPFFLVPKFAGGFTNPTLDINARQSLLGVRFTGPKIGNFQTGGRISAVFFDPSVLADQYGFLLQASYGEFFNDRWRFAAGLQFDVFAPGLPTVLPFSYLGGSGSPGNCIRGQIRVERFVDVGTESQLTLQGALSQPLNTFVTPDLILDEDNGWPNVEGRIVLGLGKPAPIGIGLLTQRPVEVGVSGLVGQLRRTAPPTETPRRVVSDVWGAAVDFRVNLAGFFGFKGEGYTGQALGNYNGAILQSLDAVTWEAISATGGFVEGFVYLKPSLHMHTGYGIDVPDDDDMTAIPNSLFARTSNSTFWSNLIWDLDKTFRIAFEATYRRTEYKEPTNLPNEGFGFHTQFAWTF